MKFTGRCRVSLHTFAATAPLGPRPRVNRIEDAGSGIAAGDLENIFKPFEKTMEGSKENEGAGSGLAISRTHARLMVGGLTMETIRFLVASPRRPPGEFARPAPCKTPWAGPPPRASTPPGRPGGTDRTGSPLGRFSHGYTRRGPRQCSRPLFLLGDSLSVFVVSFPSVRGPFTAPGRESGIIIEKCRETGYKAESVDDECRAGTLF